MRFKTLLPHLLGVSLLVCSAVFVACDDDEGGDTIAPEVAITNIQEGMMVINTINIKADANDNVAVTSVELFIDNNLLTTDTEAPYDFSWDSKSVNDGNHAIKVVASDKAGNKSESIVTISVQNTKAPIPTITNVTEGMMVINTITIKADASDNGEVTDLKLFVDGQLIATDAQTPYEFSWDSKTVADGNRLLKVVATDNSGNAGETFVNVSVQNTTPPDLVIKNVTEGMLVKNTLVVEADASDNAGVKNVQLFIDNILVASDSELPYSLSWDSYIATDGPHVVKVVATDNGGNKTEKSVGINVKNALVTLTIAADQLDQDPDWAERGFIFLSDDDGNIIAWQEYTNGSTITLKSSVFIGDKFYLTEVLNEKIGDGTDASRTRMWTYADVERGKNWVVLRDYEDPDDVYVGKANLAFTNVAADFEYIGKTEGDQEFYLVAPDASASLDITSNPALLYVLKNAMDQGLGTPLPAPTYNLYTNVIVGNNTINLGLVNKALTKKTINFPTDATYSSVEVTGFPVANSFARKIYDIELRSSSTDAFEVYYPSTAFAGYYVESYYETPTLQYLRQTTSTDFALPMLSAAVNFSFDGAHLSYTATNTDFVSTAMRDGDENTWAFVLPVSSTPRMLPNFQVPEPLQSFTIPAISMPSGYGVYDFEEITSYQGLLTFIRNSTYSLDELYDLGKNLVDIQYINTGVSNGRSKISLSKYRPFGQRRK